MMLFISAGTFKDKALFGLVKFEDIASLQNMTFDDELNLKSADLNDALREGKLQKKLQDYLKRR